jgi:hypothetical protein
MAILYKGSGPGSHWAVNDARVTGFHCFPGMAKGPGPIVQHVTVVSHPSPYVSLTASYAVAHQYAQVGVGGTATKANPGYVYQIDPGQDPALVLVDPIAALASSTHWLHDHNGGQDLILAIAAPAQFPAVLTTPPKQLAALPRPPQFSSEMQTVVFALRDAEILAEVVPRSCVLSRTAVP